MQEYIPVVSDILSNPLSTASVLTLILLAAHVLEVPMLHSFRLDYRIKSKNGLITYLVLGLIVALVAKSFLA